LKVVAIVQARMGSTRLPNKVMKLINGVPMIELLLGRLSKATLVDQIVVATSIDDRNNVLVDHVQKIGYACEQGSENDVMDRYIQAGKKHQADIVIRITGDCPLVDPVLVDECVQQFLDQDIDYLCNNYPPTLPDGLDIEVFKLAALERAQEESDKLFDQEHVTPYLRESGKFRTATIKNAEDFSSLRWTVDEPADFVVVEKVFNNFYPNTDFDWRTVLKLQVEHPEWFSLNQYIIRNEGAVMGAGQKLWKRAKQVIPGGNMLLSKRAEMFLPDQWPTYFSKAKGCKVWDLDGKEYIDMSIMGIGTNTLGYGNAEVDDAVRKVVDAGNMSTFNCPEEVYLAERLVELHPWADMVRFSRSGGEANAIAIRIARAATGKVKVAICGYHGWHDWYLSANLSDSQNLNSHLMKNLPIQGVQKNLKNSVFVFEYNNFDQLKKIVSQNNIGTVIMEVSRNEPPKKNFLENVRKLTKNKNIVLIFDECTSGFRETFGGLHLKYKINPDIATFGKALGNGYAVNAVIGTDSIMNYANSTFISSTFWTERIGSVAGLKTLEIMEKIKSWDIISSLGKKVKANWKSLAKKNNIKLNICGLSALPRFDFENNNLYYKTFVSQEFLKQNFLASNAIYLCTEHNMKIFNNYFDILDSVFFKIRRSIKDNIDPQKLLSGPVCIGGIRSKS